MNEEMIRMIKTDKKSNIEYWDKMEQACQDTVERIVNDIFKLNEDAKIDISKAVLDTIINKCKEYGINTDVAFPFIDEDY